MILSVFIVTVPAQAIVRGDSVKAHSTSHRGVTALSAIDATGAVSDTCSGVFISDHIILTAKHCISSENILVLSEIDNQTLKVPIVISNSDIVTSKDLDLAVVSVANFKSKAYSKPALREPQPGSILEARGYGSIFNLNDGMMPLPPIGRAVEHIATRMSLFAVKNAVLTFRQHSIETYASFGDSGGPVLNKKGELLGILSTVDQLDDMDQWGNLWMQNTAVSIASQPAKDFIVRALDVLTPKAK